MSHYKKPRKTPHIKVSFADRFEQVKTLLNTRPHSAQELNEALGYSGTTSIHHLLAALKIQKKIGIIDWLYTGGQRMTPLYGLGNHNVTREEFFKRNGIPECSRARSKEREKEPIPYIRTEPRPTQASNTIPAKVKESFQNGASIVVFEGKKYEKPSHA